MGISSIMIKPWRQVFEAAGHAAFAGMKQNSKEWFPAGFPLLCSLGL